MSILPELFGIYRKAGLYPLTGYSSYHFFNDRDAPFTRFLQGDAIVGCPGLALQEIMFLESLASYVQPKNVLVIGNASGWSTVALGLIFKNAKVMGIDASDAPGIELTNEIFKAKGLRGGAVLARSPEGVASACKTTLDGPIDFSLIDAQHDNPSLKADFAAVAEVASAESVHVFHDVINHNMVDGFLEILKYSERPGRLLTRTPSGMAIVYGKDASQGFRDYIECFSDSAAELQGYRHVVSCLADPVRGFEQKLT